MRGGGGSRALPILIAAIVLGALAIYIAASGHWKTWVEEPLGWAGNSTATSASGQSAPPTTADQTMTPAAARTALHNISATPDKRIPPYTGPSLYAAGAGSFTISLADAWAGGAWEWDDTARARFAVDPAEHGVADPSACVQAARTVSVAVAYQLTLPTSTIDHLDKTLHGCS